MEQLKERVAAEGLTAEVLESPEFDFAHLTFVEKVCEQALAKGDRQLCDRYGARLADLARGEEMPNCYAAILEKFREDYRAAFAPSARMQAVKQAGLFGRDAVVATAAAAHADMVERLQRPAAVSIPMGTFTVTHEGSEDYETVRLEMGREDGPLAGKVIAKYLSGPDNTTSYTGFAFVTPAGEVRRWRKFVGAPAIDKYEAAIKTVLGLDKEGQLEAREAYATRSARCSICGKPLTVPASLLRGMGPICAEREGVS